jgi:hypothetical protein
MSATRDETKGKDIAETILWARQLGDLPRISDMQRFIKREIDMSNVSAYAGEYAEQFIKRNKQWFDIEE